MPTEDNPVVDRRPHKWARPDLAQRQPRPASLYTYLLDADTDLAEEFDIRSRIAVRQLATARVLQAAVGKCDLGPGFDAAGNGPGLLILDGVVAFETRVGDRTALELVGAGDLLQSPDHRAEDLLERGDSWRVLCPARLALLDEEFADRVRPWPQIQGVFRPGWD